MEEDWNHTKYLSNRSGMKLEMNNSRKTGDFTNMWKLNNAVLKNNGLKKKSQSKFEDIQDKWKQKHNIPTLLEYDKSSSKTEIYSVKRLY